MRKETTTNESDDFASRVAWLLAPRSYRSLTLLETLRQGPFSARELGRAGQIPHPEQVYRCLAYLEDRGFLDRHYDATEEDDSAVFQITPMGLHALRLVSVASQALTPSTGKTPNFTIEILPARKRSTEVYFHDVEIDLASREPRKPEETTSSTDDEQVLV